MAFEISLIVACLAFGVTQVSGQACGGIIDLTTDPIDILSPGYATGQNYENNLDCVWTINAPVGHNITLSFAVFDVEGGNGCPYDYVTITGVESTDVSSRFCGVIDMDPIHSSGNTMSVIFHTDGTVGSRGFRLEATVSTACGEIIDLIMDPMEILSPGYATGQNYENNLDCVWTINAPVGTTIALSFADFELEGGCRRDYVTITGAESTDVSSRFCGIVDIDPIHSSGNTMSVRFHTDGSVGSLGFKLVATLSMACGGIIDLIMDPMEILSPGYATGQNYENNLDCVWTINAPVGSTIALSFADFELEGGCRFDYVTITGGESAYVSWRFCGIIDIDPIHSSGNTMSVIFHTDGYVGGRGFRLVATLSMG